MTLCLSITERPWRILLIWRSDLRFWIRWEPGLFSTRPMTDRSGICYMGYETLRGGWRQAMSHIRVGTCTLIGVDHVFMSSEGGANLNFPTYSTSNTTSSILQLLRVACRPNLLFFSQHDSNNIGVGLLLNNHLTLDLAPASAGEDYTRESILLNNQIISPAVVSKAPVVV